MLKEQIMADGQWQGDTGIYVRESLHLTPETEAHNAANARAINDAVMQKALAIQEEAIAEAPLRAELHRLKLLQLKEEREGRIVAQAAARERRAAAEEQRLLAHKNRLAALKAKNA